MAQAAEAGCDATLGAWWVPDAAADACPLFAAVRGAGARTRWWKGGARAADCAGGGAGEVARLLRAFGGLRVHRRGSSAAVLSGRLGAAEKAAARLVAFEGGLLGAQAAALEGTGGGCLVEFY